MPPEDIRNKITAKRSAEEKEAEVPETAAKPKEDEPEAKKPEEKAPKPSNGQSIAQIAEGVTADEDDDEDEDEGDKKPEKKSKKSVFDQLIETKREFKAYKREASEREMDLMKDMETVLDRVERLEKRKGTTEEDVDKEIAESFKTLKEEYALDENAIDIITKILEKKHGITKPKEGEEKKKKDLSKKPESKDDDEDGDDEEKVKQDAARKLNDIKTAIDDEYKALTETYPDLKDATSLAAIKSFILSDKKNLEKSMEAIVREMYPKALGDKPASTDGYSATGDRQDTKIDRDDPQLESKLRKDPTFRKNYQDDLRSRVRGKAKIS